MSLRVVPGLLIGGWLAGALAGTDADVDAGVAAHTAGDHEGAITHYDAAIARRGELGEILYDRGLALFAKGDKEAARSPLQRGSEVEHEGVRASSFYALGNLSLDEEDFEGAIAAYVDCLKVAPEHANAKWNLEIALRRREEEKKKEEENKDEEKQDEENKDEENKDEKKEEEKQDEEKQDEEKQDEEKQDEEKQDEQKQDEQKQDDEKQDEQKQDGEPPEPPKSIDRASLDRALQELDAEDDFQLARPKGRVRPPEKDW